MLRKENRNPNKTANTSKGIINKSMASHSITPDNSTNRINYRPKFIKKNINIQDELLQPANQIGTIHHSETYINSPASFTENNTVDIESLMFNKIKWRQNYSKIQSELKNRTQKFNASILYFNHILTDINNVVNDESIP